MSTPERAATAWSKEVAWVLESPRPWKDVLTELNKHRPPIYTGCDVSDAGLTCSRSLPADVVSVKVELIAPGPPSRARVHITASSF